MGAKVYEAKIDMPDRKETCGICLNDDINDDQMFSVDVCGHKFCSECVKQHIEVRLLEGNWMRCPHYSCKSNVTYQSAAKLLTPKLKRIWLQRMKEDLIPVMMRVYCQNPRCSALMSQTELSKTTGLRRCCVKCGEPFCINCKVPWHNNISCNHYKKLHPNPTSNDGKLKDLANKKMWRQCRKCQNMIELSRGCVRVICRCGHEFCYRCGADAGGFPHGHQFPPPTRWFWLCFFVFSLVIIAVIVVIVVIFVIR